MRIRVFSLSGFCLAVAMCFVLTLSLGAQTKKAAKAPKTSNVQGMVQNMDKAKMTIGVKSGTAVKTIVYTADTKFMVGHSNNNKPGAADDIKDGYFVSCSGTYAPGTVQLQAKQCVYRERK